jgi:hypothetical protein
MFRYLLRKLRTYQFVKVQVMQYDSFALEKDIEQRRQTIRKTIKKMGPQARDYMVYSQVKGWKTKKVKRTLTIEKNGAIRIIGETDELNDNYFQLSQVYQIVWSDASDGSSHPTINFTFKDPRKYQTLEI